MDHETGSIHENADSPEVLIICLYCRCYYSYIIIIIILVGGCSKIMEFLIYR